MKRVFSIVFFLIVLLESPALRAGEESAAPTPSPAAPTPSPAAPTPSPAAPGLQFDFFADETPTPLAAQSAEQTNAANRRRLMLQTHQILGIATWLAMGTTVVVGQLNYNDLYGGGGGSEDYKRIHKSLSYGTAGLFAITGAFALLAPEPFERPWQWDTALVHRLATLGATLGMATQVALGIFTRKQAGTGNPQSRDNARAHQVIGYTTFGLLTVAGTTWLF